MTRDFFLPVVCRPSVRVRVPVAPDAAGATPRGPATRARASTLAATRIAKVGLIGAHRGASLFKPGMPCACGYAASPAIQRGRSGTRPSVRGHGRARGIGHGVWRTYATMALLFSRLAHPGTALAVEVALLAASTGRALRREAMRQSAPCPGSEPGGVVSSWRQCPSSGPGIALGERWLARCGAAFIDAGQRGRLSPSIRLRRARSPMLDV